WHARLPTLRPKPSIAAGSLTPRALAARARCRARGSAIAQGMVPRRLRAMPPPARAGIGGPRQALAAQAPTRVRTMGGLEDLAAKPRTRCERGGAHSSPGEGNLFEALAADLCKGAGDRPSAAAPVEIAGRPVVEQRPHDQAAELAHVERVPAALKQVLAQTQALIEGIKVELVNLALEGATLTRIADGGVARHGTRHLQHQRAVTRFQGIAPPLRRAL